jgi:lysophospholipase L1-like esterase
MKRIIYFIIPVIFFQAIAQGQVKQPPFWNEIKAFKKQDSLNFPPKNAILFVGSSSFRGWRDVQNYFPDRTIINRGFGGSSLPDVIRYADEIIFAYQPKQIVIYCGENDLAASDAVSAQVVTDRFKELFTLIRKRMPKVPVVFVSIKPSPSRERLMPKMVEANKMIKRFLKKQRKTKFVDVYNPMLNEEGKPIGELFLGDKLHMNAKGYAIWKKALEPALIKKDQ